VNSLLRSVAPVDDHAKLEVGLVGNEGMLGVPLVLGIPVAPLHALGVGVGEIGAVVPIRRQAGLDPCGCRP